MGDNFLPTGVATGVGSITGKALVTSIGAAARYILPAGDYAFYNLGANVQYQVQDDSGAWNNVGAVAVGGIAISDGVNFGFVNNGASAQNVTTIKIG